MLDVAVMRAPGGKAVLGFPASGCQTLGSNPTFAGSLSFEPSRRSKSLTDTEKRLRLDRDRYRESGPRRSRPLRRDERQSIARRIAPRSHKAGRP